jgi:hypothetical protein
MTETKRKAGPRNNRDPDTVTTVNIFITERDRRRTRAWAERQNLFAKDAYGELIRLALDRIETDEKIKLVVK